MVLEERVDIDDEELTSESFSILKKLVDEELPHLSVREIAYCYMAFKAHGLKHGYQAIDNHLKSKSRVFRVKFYVHCYDPRLGKRSGDEKFVNGGK